MLLLNAWPTALAAFWIWVPVALKKLLMVPVKLEAALGGGAWAGWVSAVKVARTTTEPREAAAAVAGLVDVALTGVALAAMLFAGPACRAMIAADPSAPAARSLTPV